MSKRTLAGLASHRERKILKESFESGNSIVYDHQIRRSKSSKDLTKEPEQVLTMLRRSPADFLGSGSYGSAHRIKDETDKTICVAKISVMGTPLIGSMRSPYRPEHAENRMAHLLWHHIVESQYSPHIVMPLADHKIVPSVLPRKATGIDLDANHSVVSYMEHALHQDVRSYYTEHAEEMDTEQSDLFFRVVVFQVVYTLVAIYKVFPLFRHNDLKDDNILLQDGPDKGSAEYKINVWDEEYTFHVPCIGLRALIGDFDFACICGLIDNSKVLEEHYNTPSMNINCFKDFRSDIFIFINTLRLTMEDAISDRLKRQLNRLYKNEELDMFSKDERNLFHATPSVVETLPTAHRLLMSDLFLSFRRQSNRNPGEEVVEYWSVPEKQVKNLGPVAFPPWDPTSIISNVGTRSKKPPSIKDMVRRIPIIYPRGPHRRSKKVAINPSMAYFETWPTKPANLDTQFKEPELFRLSYWTRIRPALEMVYLKKKDKRRKKLQVGFFMPQKEMDAFMKRVEQVGTDFINSNWVSPDLWPLVFTNAFVDTVWEFDKIKCDQTCWYMDTWCEHWSTDVHYTKRQMLQFALQWSWLRHHK